jgi:alkylhydroperoxidase/carboxymuconolactone decarboxylase family protein YurZ
MDEKTGILIALGASAAANCGPCFEHYYGKAHEVGLTSDDIRAAADIAFKVKKGSDLAMRGCISDIMDDGTQANASCDCSSNESCCG